MGTLQSIAKNFARTVDLKLHVNRRITALGKRNGFRIWEEDVEAASDCILADEDVEDVEGDFVEEITDDLED